MKNRRFVERLIEFNGETTVAIEIGQYRIYEFEMKLKDNILIITLGVNNDEKDNDKKRA